MPLTTDTGTALTFIDKLAIKPEITQGTAIGDAVDLAVKRFISDNKNAKVIILFTDGENNKGEDPVKAAKKAADQGVVIFPVGIGSPQGSYIPDHVDFLGRISYKTDQKGRRVLSKLDESTLRKIASTTGGKYYNASDPNQLMAIYMELDRSLTQTYITRKMSRSEELAPLLLVAGLIMLFMESGLNYLTPVAKARKGGRYEFER
jgi:Ca-activated chloride channel family protein